MIDHAATIAVAALGLVLLAVALPMAIVYRRAADGHRLPARGRTPPKWPGEPWYAVDSGNAAELWEVCCGPRGEDGELIASMCSEGEARRIVAAVNAVAGIPTEALEAGALAKALDVLESTIAQVACEPPCAEIEEDCWSCEHRRLLRSLGRLP